MKNSDYFFLEGEEKMEIVERIKKAIQRKRPSTGQEDYKLQAYVAIKASPDYLDMPSNLREKIDYAYTIMVDLNSGHIQGADKESKTTELNRLLADIIPRIEEHIHEIKGK